MSNARKSFASRPTAWSPASPARSQRRSTRRRISPTPPAPSAPRVTTATNTGGWKLTLAKGKPPPSSGTVRAQATAELLELIRQYPKARYHALVLQSINKLYVGLRGQLSDQLREVGFCRQRLS